MFVVTMENEGGELERRVVATGEAAREALLEMIEACDELYVGDRFFVREQ
jgi:hypothetical protein